MSWQLACPKTADGHNFGLFAVAFAAEILTSKSLIDTIFMPLNFAIIV